MPATGQTSKHFPGVKLRKRKSSIINHPSLSIFARKITLEQIVLPPKKKQIVFVLGVFSMKIFNKTTFTKKTCRQNQKSTCKKLLASKKNTPKPPKPKSQAFSPLEKNGFVRPFKPHKTVASFPILPQKPRKGHGLGQNDPNKQSTRCAFCEFERNPDELDVSENSGLKPPKSSNFSRVFHYFHHPFWGTPYFWKHLLVRSFR